MNRIINYIKNDNFEFRYINNLLNIINIKEIKNINDDLIKIISNTNNMIIIKGNNLVLKKILNNEILISGSIKSIEM